MQETKDPAPEGREGKMQLIPTTLAVAGGVIAGALVLKSLRKESEKNDASFRTIILEEVAQALAPKLDLPKEAILATLVEGITDPDRIRQTIPALTRLELEIRKESPTAVTRTTAIAIDLNGRSVLKITRKVSWDVLPSDIRHDFIRSGEASQVYDLLHHNLA